MSNFSFRQVITHKMVEFKDGRWKNVCFLCLKYGRKKVVFYLKQTFEKKSSLAEIRVFGVRKRLFLEGNWRGSD